MRYITHRRYKGNTVCGRVNIPAMTEVEEQNGLIYYNGLPVCVARSDVGTSHFCRNDNEDGMERGRLTREITSRLVRHGIGDTNNDKRWRKIWSDELCQKYKRDDFADYWLWNYDFFQAPIEDLQYILALISA